MTPTKKNTRRKVVKNEVKHWSKLLAGESLVKKPMLFEAVPPLTVIRNVDGKRVDFEVTLTELLNYIWLVPTPATPRRPK